GRAELDRRQPPDHDHGAGNAARLPPARQAGAGGRAGAGEDRAAQDPAGARDHRLTYRSNLHDVDLESAIRTRRTHKAFRPEPLATGCACYIVLLAAHARGLVGYWRTPGVLRTAEGRATVGLPDDERFVGLLHLGWGRQEKEPPGRAPARDYVTYLE